MQENLFDGNCFVNVKKTKLYRRFPKNIPKFSIMFLKATRK